MANHAGMMQGKNSLVKIGGSMGIAGSFIAMAVFIVGLQNLNQVFMLSILPLLLGGIGMVITVVGAVIRTHAGEEETQPVSALFACAFAVLFGIVEWYIWVAMPAESVRGPI